MPTPEPHAHPLERCLLRLAEVTTRWPKVVLSIGLVGLVAGGVASTRLELDARLEALLPTDTRAAHAIETYRTRVSAGAPLQVLVEGPRAEVVSDAVRDALAEWPDVAWALNRRETSSLYERRLLLLGESRIEQLADDLEQNVEHAECESMPGCVAFEEPPELPTREALTDEARSLPLLRRLSPFVGSSEGTEGTERSTSAELDPRLCNDSVPRVCLVQAGLEGDPGDLAFAAEVGTRVDALAERWGGGETRIELAGRYRTLPQIRAIAARDLRRTGALGALLVLAIVAFAFRRRGRTGGLGGWRALFLVGTPLAIGMGATLCLLAWLHPVLNLIGAFTFAILGGVGIDFGLHLASRLRGALAEGLAVGPAVQRTLTDIGRSLLVAAFTTSLAFGALAVADFRGFAEMGVLAGAGVLLSAVSFLIFFAPAAVLVAQPSTATTNAQVPRSTPALPTASRSVAWRVVLAGCVLAVVGGWVGRGVSFEYDFRRLRPTGVSNSISADGTQSGTRGTPVVVLADSAESLATLDLESSGPRSAFGVAPDEVAVLAPTDLGALLDPSEATLAALGRMGRALDRARDHVDAEVFSELRPLASVGSLEPETLPTWLRAAWLERDGTMGRMALIYVPLRGSDARAMERLHGQIETWRDAHPDLVFACPEATLGEIVPGLRRDAPRMMGLALLGLLLATMGIGRSLRRTLLVVAPVLLTMAVSAGVLAWLDVRLNLYDVLVLPVAFGVLIDGAVYLAWAEDDAARRHAAGAVCTSTLTTLSAFGALAVADNPGIASIAHVAMVVFTVGLFANLLWLPHLLRLVNRAAHDQGAAVSPDTDTCGATLTHPDAASPKPTGAMRV